MKKAKREESVKRTCEKKGGKGTEGANLSPFRASQGIGRPQEKELCKRKAIRSARDGTMRGKKKRKARNTAEKALKVRQEKLSIGRNPFVGAGGEAWEKGGTWDYKPLVIGKPQ